MSSLSVIARKELAQRLRDRTFFIIGIVAPLALAFIFNLVLGGVISGNDNPTFDFGVADADTGLVSDGFDTVLAGMAEEGLVNLTRYDSAEAASAAVDAGDIDAAFILPANLSTAVISGSAASIEVLQNIDSSFGSQVARAIAEGFAERTQTTALGAAAAITAGVLTPTAAAAAATAAASAAPPVVLQEVRVQARQLSAPTFFIAGLGIFFIIFVAGLATSSLLEERANGTLARLLAAPIPPAAIIGGKTAATVVLGILAMAILAVVSTLLMDADWGNPLFSLLVVVAAVLAVAGIMTFVGGLARTAEQAQNLQAIVAVTLAMLGGTFVPIGDDQGLLSTLRYITPNAWYIRGFADVAGGATADMLLSIGVLLAIAAGFGGVGLILVRRALRP